MQGCQPRSAWRNGAGAARENSDDAKAADSQSVTVRVRAGTRAEVSRNANHGALESARVEVFVAAKAEALGSQSREDLRTAAPESSRNANLGVPGSGMVEDSPGAITRPLRHVAIVKRSESFVRGMESFAARLAVRRDRLSLVLKGDRLAAKREVLAQGRADRLARSAVRASRENFARCRNLKDGSHSVGRRDHSIEAGRHRDRSVISEVQAVTGQGTIGRDLMGRGLTNRDLRSQDSTSRDLRNRHLKSEIWTGRVVANCGSRRLNPRGLVLTGRDLINRVSRNRALTSRELAAGLAGIQRAGRKSGHGGHFDRRGSDQADSRDQVRRAVQGGQKQGSEDDREDSGNRIGQAGSRDRAGRTSRVVVEAPQGGAAHEQADDGRAGANFRRGREFVFEVLRYPKSQNR